MRGKLALAVCIGAALSFGSAGQAEEQHNRRAVVINTDGTVRCALGCVERPPFYDVCC